MARLRFLGGCWLALAQFGCDEPSPSRQLAVTVTDADNIECVGTSNSEALEPKTLDTIAKDVERSWEDLREQEPPSPEGRILRINETERETTAWFDPHPDHLSAFDPDGFDGPSVVYIGAFQDDYIEGSYRDIFNTDEQDEEAARELCGDRLRVSGTLSLTDAKGILGRIRWHHRIYVDSVTSACAGQIDCVRDVAVSGLELE